MTVAITATTTLLVAGLGFLFTYFHSRRLQERNDRLTRINRQLGELYGPAFALTDSTRISFEAFRSKYGDIREQKEQQEMLSAEQVSAWKCWMTTIFQPANKRVFELIMTKGDLLLDEEMPECISQFCAHVTSYDVILEGWKSGSPDIFAVVDYPPNFTDYVRLSYRTLKRRQSTLLADGVSRSEVPTSNAT